MKFRTDINGLRALAVLLVVIFHYKKSLIPAGFIGVDVFFVISGYLMTSILYAEMNTDRLNYVSFITKRFNRIVPALSFLLIAVTSFNYFFLSAEEYLILAKHSLTSLSFISNFTYFSETGYFDTLSLQKWFLHTWSLSVEWQFYLLYPILFFFIKGNKLIRSIILITFISFVLSFFTSKSDPSFSYYMLPIRAWEMLIGGISFFVFTSFSHRIKNKNILLYIGVIVIIISAFIFDENTVWPGYLALIPVLATALVLISNGETRIFNNKITQFTGSISYSLYLWHWPIVVYLYSNNLATNQNIVIAFLVAVFLSTFSYYVIENRMKSGVRAVSIFIVALALSSVMYIGDGFANRFLKETQYIKDFNPASYFEFNKNLRTNKCHEVDFYSESYKKLCVTNKGKDIVLWGDSYAASLYSGLEKLINDKGFNYDIYQLTNWNSPPFFLSSKTADNGKTLLELNNEKLQYISEIKPEKVIVTWMFNGGKGLGYDGTVKNIEILKEKIKKVSRESNIILIGPMPNWNPSLKKIYENYWDENKSELPKYTKIGLDLTTQELDVKYKNKFESLGIEYISAYKILCNNEGCLTRVGSDINSMTTIDFGHLNYLGANYFWEKANIFKQKI